MAAPLLIGVAGWSYPDWKGIVYPKGCKDPLRFVAGLVDLIEINTSFYRVPDPELVASWARRVEDLPLRFTAKLPQEVTHQRRLEAGTVRAFQQSFEVLCCADRLDALLAQFSYRLEADAAAFDWLGKIAAAFGGMAPLILEVRHQSWRQRDAQARVAELGFRLAHLDWPGQQSGFAEPALDLDWPRGPAYLRLHGRNQATWFDKDAGRDQTYDWLYSEREVDSIEQRISKMAALHAATAVMVVANNHFRGQAPKVALELLSRHRGGKVEVPPGMQDAFPSLRRIARNSQGKLF